MEKIKVIIDTDCGVDDALALMLAFSREDLCEVSAITCCHGNTNVDNVCDNVLRVCEACDITQLDIYRGCHRPLIDDLCTENFFGTDGFGEKSIQFPKSQIKVKDEHAVQALIRLAKENPRQITIIAIAPLTNLAMAQRIDPTFFNNLKEIFILGGNIDASGNITTTAEFNFFVDPEAAHIVLSEEANFTIIPWETCEKHEMEKVWFSRWLERSKGSKKGMMINKIMPIIQYSDENEIIEITNDADVLAVAAAIYPNCVSEFVKRPVSIELRGSLTRGQTIVEKRIEHLQKKNKFNKKIITKFKTELLEKLRNSILDLNY